MQETATGSKSIYLYRCDLTNSDDIQQMLPAIERDGHRVDTLIGNAAIFGFDSLAGGLDLHEAKQIIDANLFVPSPPPAGRDPSHRSVSADRRYANARR